MSKIHIKHKSSQTWGQQVKKIASVLNGFEIVILIITERCEVEGGDARRQSYIWERLGARYVIILGRTRCDSPCDGPQPIGRIDVQAMCVEEACGQGVRDS